MKGVSSETSANTTKEWQNCKFWFDIAFLCVNIKKERESEFKNKCVACVWAIILHENKKRNCLLKPTTSCSPLSENDVLARVCYLFKINDNTTRYPLFLFQCAVCLHNGKQSSRNVYWLLATVLVTQVNTLCKQRRSATFQPTRNENKYQT